MSDTPLGIARLDFMAARERLLYKDTPLHRQALEDARAALDTLLDAYPGPRTPTPPSTPDGPGAPSPGPSVSLVDELLAMGEDECEHSAGEQYNEGEQ